MADRYNVRNVAQKEIYDSYMGILRISPNTYYSKDQDDPTLILETLVDINHAFQGESKAAPEETKIILSDSDGNKLPIVFVPKAFKTNVLIKKPQSGAEGREEKDLVNLTTYSESDIHISSSFTARSTIRLTNPENKISKLMIISGCSPNTVGNTVTGDEILIYPIENPNDDHFFNYRNRHDLFDSTITDKPRHEQMEENLLNWSLDDYKQMITNHKTRIKEMYSSYTSSTDKDKKRYATEGEDPQVKVAGKYINTYNNFNEEIPVLYTRDYILGHYDGHALPKSKYSSVSGQWCHNNKSSDAAITKLSWIRFDNLVWEALDEVLSGKVRHTKGRYDMLGESGKENYRIDDNVLFRYVDTNGNSSVDGNCTLSSSNSTYLKDTAPLLGKGVQEGMIMYHAMPFHRFWFHRCRQIVYNMERWSTLHRSTTGNSVTDWKKYNGGKISEDIDTIQEAKRNSLITPCCKASITPHHSLVKDFLLCNGQEVNFQNFPNINLSNYNLLDIDNPGKEAETKLSNDGVNTYFPERSSSDTTPSQTWTTGTYNALFNTSGSENGKIKLPNLYSFTEAYPRFIRSFNWQHDESDNTVEFNTDTDFTDILTQENWKYKLHSEQMIDDAGEVKNNPTDIHGHVGIDIQKPFTQYGLYYFNYDYLTPHKKHYHNLWSAHPATNGNTDFSGRIYVTHGYNSSTAIHFEDKKTDYGSVGGLTNNFTNPSTTFGKQWFNYCINFGTQFFHNFTPIPNLGLMLWNSSIYNQEEKDYKYKGTLQDVENGNNSSFGFINGQDETITMTGDFKLTTTLIGYAMNPSDAQANYVKLNDVRTQRFKRRQQAIKFNEAEGRLPISSKGTGQYSIYTRHVFLRKRSWGSRLCGDKWDTEHGNLHIKNVTNYKFGTSLIAEGDSDDDRLVGWICLTSLPYERPEYLGCGDTTAITDVYLDLNSNTQNKKSKPHDYYINHNVTDKWKPSVVIRTTDVKHGGVVIKNNIESPHPSYMNLLPLIRL